MKTKYLYNLLFIGLLLLASCSEDFLDLQPLDQQVSSTFYTNEEDMMQALTAVYDAVAVQAAVLYGGDNSWVPIVTMSDIMADDAFAGGSDANDGKEAFEFDQYNVSPTNPKVQAIWKKNYIAIYRANLFLEKIDGAEADSDFKARTIAEAKFLRAYSYFELVRYFENIPLLTATIKGPSEYIQPQAEPDDVYNQITLDLVEAIVDLPETDASAQTGRVTKWAAQGLLARTYLFYNGVYGKELFAGALEVNKAYVLQELEYLITNGGFDLFDNYEDNFKVIGEFGIESVFELSHGNTPPWSDWDYVVGGNGNLAAQMQGPRVSGSDRWDRGWSFGIISHKLALDLEGDPRFEATILTEEYMDSVFTVDGKGKLVKGFQHTGYFSNKYSSDAEHWGIDGSLELNRTCNYRAIRYSDVLLMAAELGSANAQQYLDDVRDRVELGSVPANIENIMRERRLELSLEGLRYWDLLRQGMAVTESELTVTGIMGPNYNGDQIIYDHAFNTETRGLLPIPQTEIDLSNGALEQNDGY